MKGYTYIHEGKVVVNPRKRPEFDIKEKYGVITKRDIELNEQALSEWESKHIAVENVKQYHFEAIDNFHEGQEVSYKLQGKKSVITKIN